MYVQLSQRLKDVATYVPKGAKLLDVGSDHAYLPIYLLEKGLITSAIAGEVVKGPYESALANVSASGFNDKIDVRLANGLAAFEPYDAVTTITICGMGGRLIADILDAGKDKLKDVDRLILQPNNREDDLRIWLMENGFTIVAEAIMTENGKYYEIIVAEAGQMNLSEREIRFGPHLMKEQSQVFQLKWQREINKLEIALGSIPLANQDDRAVLEEKFKPLRRFWTMLASDLIKSYESFCPPELSMEGDVVGLQIGSLDKEIQKVMVTLDVRENTVAEVIEKGVDLIIAKHAPIFRPVKDLVSSPDRDILLDLVKHDIAVYVSHTNIDVVDEGLNDWFCELLDIKDTTYLTETAENQGIGRVGDIVPQTIEDLALKVKSAFGLDSVRLVRYNHDNPLVNRVAICGGSGQGFYKDALKKGAQVFITGDIYYHTGQEMITNGLLAIDPGHHIEALFVSKIAEKLEVWKREHNWHVTILESQSSTNPFDHL